MSETNLNIKKKRDALHQAILDGKVPWIVTDQVAHQCVGGLILAKFPNPCPLAAHWEFTKSGQSSAKEGWLCWSHLQDKAINADGVERKRMSDLLIDLGYWTEHQR